MAVVRVKPKSEIEDVHLMNDRLAEVLAVIECKYLVTYMHFHVLPHNRLNLDPASMDTEIASTS